ncbi:MAG: radical SAM protein, partial [Rhodospirillaceae bacterium]
MTDNTIVFADLTHTGKKLDATFMPLAVSYIASYFKSQRPDAEVELFKYPTDLATYLAANDVRVAAFSDYCWNERLSLGFARAIKKMSPRTVTIFGGPNCPYDPAEIAAFLGERPGVDFYVAGEGEIAFVELYDALAAVDFDVARLKRAGTQVSNTRYLDGDGQLVCGPMLPRMNDLDVIPSPYLSGMMDKFFDGRLTPMIQNARGCPYSCTFCHDGLEYMTKYRRFDHGRICDEIDYVKDRKKGPALCIVDDNFGIHKNDLAVAKKIGAIRTDTGWPNFISYGGTAKNNKERIVEISREMGDAIEAGASVQSTDADVLASIKRSNISTVTISDMARKVAENGVTSFTENILCLPGDTIEKHQHSVYEMMDLDIQDFKLFQFILLPGTEAASTAHREKFAYATAWRVFPRCFGHYEVGGERFSVAEAS